MAYRALHLIIITESCLDILLTQTLHGLEHVEYVSIYQTRDLARYVIQILLFGI